LAEIARQVLANELSFHRSQENRITLLEGGPRILPTYPEDLSRSAEEQRNALRRRPNLVHMTLVEPDLYMLEE